MKRLISLVIALTLVFSLAATAMADGAAGPEKPDWIPDGLEYVTFPNDSAYSGESWQRILTLRELAEKGGTDEDAAALLPNTAAAKYETGLMYFRAGLVSGDGERFRKAISCFRSTMKYYGLAGGEEYDGIDIALHKWRFAAAAAGGRLGGEAIVVPTMTEVVVYAGMSVDEFLDIPYIRELTQEEKDKTRAGIEREIAGYKDKIYVWLDGYRLPLATAPLVVNQRTMVPVRSVSELLGADVSWDQATQSATLVRAGVTVRMTVGSRIATVNGKSFEMDVEPLVVNERILIPARYISEFFGQKVKWLQSVNRVDITEDKTAGERAAERPVLAMGAYICSANNGDPLTFGMWSRSDNVYYNDGSAIDKFTDAYKRARMILGDSWGITSREELIDTIRSMTTDGNNPGFLADAKTLRDLTPKERGDLEAVYGDIFTPTEELYAKWGDKGILAWDLFRISTLAQWGYTAGYLTYSEAMELTGPSVELLRNTFTSWEEAMENYVDGYLIWSGEYKSGIDTWQTRRGSACRRTMEAYSQLFDDGFFAGR